MNDDHNLHLSESQILVSLVDETDLPPETRSHLAMCAHCQAVRQLQADRLQRFTDLAGASVPRSSRRIILPEETLGLSRPGLLRFGTSSWRLALILGAMAALVLLVTTLWWKPIQQRQLAKLNQEWQEDGVLLAEVQRLTTEPLPTAYGLIAGEEPLDAEEDPWDWLVPDDDAPTLSKRGSGVQDVEFGKGTRDIPAV
jgi:hypothetical protein